MKILYVTPPGSDAPLRVGVLRCADEPYGPLWACVSWSSRLARGYCAGDSDVQYRTAPAERGDIAYTISATGTPNAVVTVQVGSQVSGNIKALYADFNTKVQKGQVVAQIDPQLFQARVDQERANLNAAQAAVLNAQAQIRKNEADVASGRATLADAKSNVVKAQSAVGDAKSKLDRRLELVKEGVLAKEEGETAQTTYDQAQAMLESARSLVISAQTNITALEAQVEVANSQRATAQAQVKQAEASLKQAEVDLENTVIRAPVDGVVVARQIDVGQTVAASMQAPTLFSIAQDLTRMQVDTNVSEADVGRVVVRAVRRFYGGCIPGSGLSRKGDVDPQGADQCAECGDVRCGDRRGESRSEAVSGDDGEREPRRPKRDRRERRDSVR